MSQEISIRTLDPAGVARAIDWAAEEGWNPGLDDAAPFRNVDPEGFLGLFVDGAMAASISVIAYNASFAFIGFYICRKDLRGRGYGKRLWDAGLQRLGTRTVGLDGVIAQQPNYAASGFVLAHRNIRYHGAPSVAHPVSPAVIEVGDDAPDSLVHAIAAYDRPFFPAPRDEFVHQWIGHSETRRTIAFVEGGSMRGYGTVRRCRKGFKIGPLFADDAEIAAAIFTALVGPLRGEAIMLDVPEPNAAARDLAERYEMSPIFETARMYRNGIPSLPLEQIFGITSFELG